MGRSTHPRYGSSAPARRGLRNRPWTKGANCATIQQGMLVDPAPGSTPAPSGRAAGEPGLHRAALCVGAAALAVLGASACGAVSGAVASRSLNVCKLLPRSEVSSVTGASVVHASSAKLGAFPAPTGHMCTYDLRD